MIDVVNAERDDPVSSHTYTARHLRLPEQLEASVLGCVTLAFVELNLDLLTVSKAAVGSAEAWESEQSLHSDFAMSTYSYDLGVIESRKGAEWLRRHCGRW